MKTIRLQVQENMVRRVPTRDARRTRDARMGAETTAANPGIFGIPGAVWTGGMTAKYREIQGVLDGMPANEQAAVVSKIALDVEAKYAAEEESGGMKVALGEQRTLVTTGDRRKGVTTRDFGRTISAAEMQARIDAFNEGGRIESRDVMPASTPTRDGGKWLRELRDNNGAKEMQRMIDSENEKRRA